MLVLYYLYYLSSVLTLRFLIEICLNSSDQIGESRFAGESKLIFNDFKTLIEKMPLRF